MGNEPPHPQREVLQGQHLPVQAAKAATPMRSDDLALVSCYRRVGVSGFVGMARRSVAKSRVVGHTAVAMCQKKNEMNCSHSPSDWLFMPCSKKHTMFRDSSSRVVMSQYGTSAE